jgi:hypothetical protein
MKFSVLFFDDLLGKFKNLEQKKRKTEKKEEKICPRYVSKNICIRVYMKGEHHIFVQQKPTEQGQPF